MEPLDIISPASIAKLKQARDDMYDLFKFSYPYVLSSLLDVARGFITNAQLSHLGEDYLEAGALISSSQLVIISLNCCAYATAYEVGSVIKGDLSDPEQRARLSEIASASSSFAIALSAGLMVVVKFNKEIFLGLNQDRDLVDITNEYYQGYLSGVPAVVGLSFLQQYVLGHSEREDSNLVMYSIMINTGLTGLLGYLLAYGPGQIPEYGARGLGVANTVASWAALVLLTSYMYCKSRYSRDLNLFTDNVRSALFENVVKLSKLGGFISLRAGSELISLFVATLMLAKLGDDVLESVNVANQYMFVMVMPLFRLTQTTSIKISPLFKAGNMQRVHDITEAGNHLGVLMNLIMGSVVFAIPKPLISVFMGNPTHQEFMRTRDLLWINTASQLPDFPKNTYGNVINTMGDGSRPLIISLLWNCFVALTLGYVMTYPLNMDAPGMYTARLIATVAAAINLHMIFNARIQDIGVLEMGKKQIQEICQKFACSLTGRDAEFSESQEGRRGSSMTRELLDDEERANDYNGADVIVTQHN